MDEFTEHQKATDLLQEFGLKEYEARSFVALSRLPKATAKELSEISEVPRTRVYDAIRVLESKGLVEIQHSSPQEFRAMSIDEAAKTLQDEYENRSTELEHALRGLEPVDVGDGTAVSQEVWSLSGTSAIENRTQELVENADEELLFVIGDRSVATDSLLELLRETHQRNVTVVIGTGADELGETVGEAIPEAQVFVSGLEWLRSSHLPEDDTEIGRLLMVDRSSILVSSFHRNGPDARHHEQAVFGSGFDNGLVTIVRRLMATGLLPVDDPHTGDTTPA